ncbi:MAG: hypothetical protein K2I69_01360 [Muribaculaceae bacterium]|nr:hypothetical protein [Muribaculaceae bacterium]
MKVLVVYSNEGKVLGGADSAILRQGEPVFVADPVENYRSSVALAIRIKRLGTHIPVRKALDFIDAFAPVHLLLPAESGQLPPFFMDRAISPGQWTPIDEMPAEMEICVAQAPIPNEPEFLAKSTFSKDSLQIPQTLACLSEQLTFRTGDIIIFADTATQETVPRTDFRLTAAINGIPALDIKIK